MTDNSSMEVQSSSMHSALIQMAKRLKSEDFGMQWSTAVMKQIQDQNEREAAALLRMIDETTRLCGLGQNVDLCV